MTPQEELRSTIIGRYEEGDDLASPVCSSLSRNAASTASAAFSATRLNTSIMSNLVACFGSRFAFPSTFCEASSSPKMSRDSSNFGRSGGYNLRLPPWLIADSGLVLIDVGVVLCVIGLFRSTVVLRFRSVIFRGGI